VIFRIVYGGKPQNEGQRIVEQFFKSRFKKAFLWIEATKILSQQRLYVEDAYGKRRHLLEVKTWRGIGGVGRAGINSPIQGVASHIAMQITYTCWRLFKKYGLKSKIIFGVQDSVVGDIHPDEINIVIKIVRLAFAKLRETQMWKAFPIAKILPMQGELYLGESWGWIDKMSEAKQLEYVPCSSHDTITEDDVMEEMYI
jgi:DNA polymerase I-like protein with 3'-5' exonuclease and polymerase domains